MKIPPQFLCWTVLSYIFFLLSVMYFNLYSDFFGPHSKFFSLPRLTFYYVVFIKDLYFVTLFSTECRRIIEGKAVFD